MILNRRALLAAVGLTLPALIAAEAEAADSKKKVKKPKPAHGPKVASHKPRRAKPGTPAPTQS